MSDAASKNSGLVCGLGVRTWTVVGLIAVLAVGLGLRVYQLEAPLMWCDEAESSINALTILEHGVPVEKYLGLPIYENTLTEPWPDHPEYEFKDSSYSKKGLAIYHGWLPLYSMAASFKLAGVEPDTDTTNLRPIHDYNAIRVRTLAGRMPAVVFGMFMLVILYVAGKDFFGRDAGWTAMVTTAIAVPMVNISRQARYYSLTATLSAACCLMAWRMSRKGRWRDFILGGVVFAMLFHTHLLTFAIACAATALLLPSMLKHERSIPKLLVCGLIVAGASLPWIYYTGFLDAAQSVPKAIATMKLPQDLLAWPKRYWAISTVLLAGMAWVSLLHVRPNWLPKKLVQPFAENRAAFYFLSAWILLSFFMFMFMIPAASLFFQRLYLGAVGPGIIFGAMIFAGFGRSVPGRVGVPIAAVAFVAFVWMNTRAGYWWERSHGSAHRFGVLVEDIRTWELKPNTRVYSTPNDHLTLTFYTGIPVQSIAPVRKSFLDNYPHDVVLVLCWVPLYPLMEHEVSSFAADAGVNVPAETLKALTDRINRTAAAQKVIGKVNRTVPQIEPMPTFADPLLAYQEKKTTRWLRQYDFTYNNPSVFRGFDFKDHLTMWQIFFYRFANPLERIGEKANYADRLKRSEARILPTLWTVYTSPGLVEPDQERIAGGKQ